MKRTILTILLIGLVLGSCSKSQGGTPGGGETDPVTLPRKEMRAVWIASVDRMDWPRSYDAEAQKKQYTDYLDQFRQYDINTVVMQIRPMADAFFPSALEPWSQFITGTQGTNPGYDVLRFMIDEAHKRGMEFHAWLNPYRISNNVNTFRPAPSHIYNTHPEWTMTYGKLLIFRPALPEVRQHLVDVIDEIITNYDVDGIHFDDYFYPYPASGVELDDQGDFLKYGAGFDDIEDFRRDNVNQVIRSIHELIVAKRPDVLFSISPYGVWRNSTDDPAGSQTAGITNYDDLYADIRLWCEQGWIDYVVPQLYASTENINMNFIKQVKWWAENSFDVPVVIGHGLYKFGNPAEGQIFMNPLELENQFFYARRNPDIAGSMMFNASAFANNKIDILSTVAKIYAKRTVPPFFGRHTSPEPGAVQGLSLSGGTLSWNDPGQGLRAVVYRIDDDDQAHVVTITTGHSIPAEKGTRYGVSLLNGDNAEGPLSLAQ